MCKGEKDVYVGGANLSIKDLNTSGIQSLLQPFSSAMVVLKMRE